MNIYTYYQYMKYRERVIKRLTSFTSCNPYFVTRVNWNHGQHRNILCFKYNTHPCYLYVNWKYHTCVRIFNAGKFWATHHNGLFILIKNFLALWYYFDEFYYIIAEYDVLKISKIPKWSIAKSVTIRKQLQRYQNKATKYMCLCITENSTFCYFNWNGNYTF